MLGMRTLVLTVLLGSIAAASACTLLPGPEITCQDPVAAEDCDRAVDLARPLLAAYWDRASEALVHLGVCADQMECSERQAKFPGYLTVELVSDQPEAASVVIDHRTGDWSVVTCRVIVPDAHGAHGERCAAS